MNRRAEKNAALARKAAEALLALKAKEGATAAPTEREIELEADALKTARLRALRLAKESAEMQPSRR